MFERSLNERKYQERSARSLDWYRKSSDTCLIYSMTEHALENQDIFLGLKERGMIIQINSALKKLCG